MENMKVYLLLVSTVLLSLHTPATALYIKAAMPKEVYKRLVRQGATSLSGNMKNLACKYFSQSQSCQLASKNRRALDNLSFLYLTRVNKIPDEHQIPPNFFEEAKNRQRGLRRSTRSIPGNPCTHDYGSPKIHFYGEDVLEKKIVELLQNPAIGEYQTFFSYPCARKTFSSWPCEPQSMEYMAAVFVDYDKVSYRRIKLPTTCAITIGTRG